MASVIQDDAQMRALEEINATLEEVRVLNARINAKEPYAIRVNKKQMIQVDENLGIRVESILRMQRERRIKDILNKAAKYRISLSEEEQAAISEDSVATRTDG